MESSPSIKVDKNKLELTKVIQENYHSIKVLKLEKYKKNSLDPMENSFNSHDQSCQNFERPSNITSQKSLLMNQEPDISKKSLKSLKIHLEHILFNSPLPSTSNIPSDLQKYLLEVKRLKIFSSSLTKKPESSFQQPSKIYSFFLNTRIFKVFSTQNKGKSLSKDFKLRLKNFDFDIFIKNTSVQDLLSFTQFFDGKFDLSEKISKTSKNFREILRKFNNTKYYLLGILDSFHQDFEAFVSENIEKIRFFQEKFVKISDFNHLQLKYFKLNQECEIFKNQIFSLHSENQEMIKKTIENQKKSEEILKTFNELQAEKEKNHSLFLQECQKNENLLLNLEKTQKKIEELSKILQEEVQKSEIIRKNQEILSNQHKSSLNKITENQEHEIEKLKKNHEARIIEKDLKIQDLLEKVKDLNEIVKNFQERFLLEDERNKRNAQKDLNDEINLESLIYENVFMNEKIQSLEKDLKNQERMMDEIDYLKEQNRGLAWKLENFQNSEESDEMIRDLLDRAENENQIVRKFREEIIKKTEEESNLRMNLNLAYEKIEILQQKLDLESKENRKKTENLQSELTSIHEESTYLRSNMMKYQALYEKESKLHQNIQKELHLTKNSLSSLKLEFSELSSILIKSPQTEFELKSLKKDYFNLQEQVKSLNINILKLQENLKEKTEEFQMLSFKFSSKHSKIVELKKKVKVQKKLIENLNVKVGDFERNFKENHENEGLEKDIKRFKEKEVFNENCLLDDEEFERKDMIEDENFSCLQDRVALKIDRMNKVEFEEIKENKVRDSQYESNEYFIETEKSENIERDFIENQDRKCSSRKFLDVKKEESDDEDLINI